MPPSMIAAVATVPASVTAVPTVVMVMVTMPAVVVVTVVTVEPAIAMLTAAMIAMLRIGRHAKGGCDGEHRESH